MKFRNSHLPNITPSSDEQQLDLGCFQDINDVVPLLFSATPCEGMALKIGSADRIIKMLKHLGKGHKYLAKPLTGSLESIPSKSTFVIPVLTTNLKERGTNAT
jgi:hypothetical protein